MIEHSSWMLPAAKEAYKHRKEIEGAWNQLSQWMFGEKHNIVFTGCAGVGKSVLLDHLAGNAYKEGYRPPSQSQREEKGRLPALKKRIRLLTIPGQDTGPRRDLLKSLIDDKKPIDGIIHVVANGYASPRSSSAEISLATDFNLETIENLRKAQLNIELDDLRRTCDFIRDRHQRDHRPKWLIVAVAKVDLYYDQIDDARITYSPLGKSDFSTLLNELRNDVGRYFFRWDAAPVCTWLEDFSWNKDTAKCELLPAQRDHYIAAFADKLKSFC